MITVTAPKRNTMNEYNINGYFVYVIKVARYSHPSGTFLSYEYVLNITDDTKIIIHTKPYKKFSEVKQIIKNITGGN